MSHTPSVVVKGTYQRSLDVVAVPGVRLRIGDRAIAGWGATMGTTRVSGVLAVLGMLALSFSNYSAPWPNLGRSVIVRA